MSGWTVAWLRTAPLSRLWPYVGRRPRDIRRRPQPALVGFSRHRREGFLLTCRPGAWALSNRHRGLAKSIQIGGNFSSRLTAGRIVLAQKALQTKNPGRLGDTPWRLVTNCTIACVKLGAGFALVQILLRTDRAWETEHQANNDKRHA